jgi:hypothetical protein
MTTTVARLTAFYGLEYYLTKQLIIQDVHLVYASPKSVGGDIDNY